jgi:hypothetical protein
MYLTADNLAHYLISSGLISATSVVDGDYTVVETGRRNSKCSAGGCPGCL